jgi:hypothetical protein
MVFGIGQSGTDIQNSNRPTPNDQNLMGWAYDPANGVSASTLTAGQIALIKVIAIKSGTVNNLYLGNSTPAAGGLVNSFVGLYDTAGNRLGLSADQSSAWNGAGAGSLKATMTSGVAVVLGTAYYVAVLVGTATTAPNLVRGVQNNMHNAGLVTAGTQRVMTSGTGLSALPSTITMSGAAASNNSWWAAIGA